MLLLEKGWIGWMVMNRAICGIDYSTSSPSICINVGQDIDFHYLTTVKRNAKILEDGRFTFAGTHDYVYQSTQLQLGEQTERDLAQTALSAATGAVVAPLFVGGIGLVASTPRWLRSINENRISKIDNNENYKTSYLETTVKKLRMLVVKQKMY